MFVALIYSEYLEWFVAIALSHFIKCLAIFAVFRLNYKWKFIKSSVKPTKIMNELTWHFVSFLYCFRKLLLNLGFSKFSCKQLLENWARFFRLQTLNLLIDFLILSLMVCFSAKKQLLCLRPTAKIMRELYFQLAKLEFPLRLKLVKIYTGSSYCLKVEKIREDLSIKFVWM